MGYAFYEIKDGEVATEVTMWLSDDGATYATKALAERADLVYALTQAITHPTKAREIAEQIVTDFQALKAVIKDRSQV